MDADSRHPGRRYLGRAPRGPRGSGAGNGGRCGGHCCNDSPFGAVDSSTIGELAMTCPPGVAEIVLEILTMGLLRIRMAGWSGEGRICASEADHLHNLPELLSAYSPERLSYYWE